MVKSAEQLREMELNGPDDIYEDTAEEWQRLIKLKFPILASRHNFTPSNPKAWHEVYEHYKELDEENLARSTALLTQQLTSEKESVRHSTFISPEESNKFRSTRAKRGFGVPREKQTVWKKTKEHLRLEATRFNLRTPTGQLPVPAGQIKKAPEAMVNEARIKSQPSIRAPSKKLAAAPSSTPNDDLAAKKTPTTASSPAPASAKSLSPPPASLQGASKTSLKRRAGDKNDTDNEQQPAKRRRTTPEGSIAAAPPAAPSAAAGAPPPRPAVMGLPPPPKPNPMIKVFGKLKAGADEILRPPLRTPATKNNKKDKPSAR